MAQVLGIPEDRKEYNGWVLNSTFKHRRQICLTLSLHLSPLAADYSIILTPICLGCAGFLYGLESTSDDPSKASLI